MHLPTDEKHRSTRYLELGEMSLRVLERSKTNAGTFGALWRLGQMQFLLLAGEGHEVESRSRRDDARHLPPALQAEWRVARGISFERASRLSPGAATRQSFATTPVPRMLWAERNRQRAMDEYRLAFEADPTHLETRVRMGRVFMELGRANAARGHLEAAATGQCVETVCGLGWLFLGEWHMTHGKAEDAQTCLRSGISRARRPPERSARPHECRLAGAPRVGDGDQPAVAALREGVTR